MISDIEDTENKMKDFIRRTNCLLANFGVCCSAVKSCLLQFASFYGAALWRLVCPDKMLHRIWNFP